MFSYYTISDSEQIRFYQLPKELVKNEQFKGLSDSAKILYALLRDRISLSVKNGWVDEFGRVYIIFTLAEIMADLGCADQKATKSMKELQKTGLVESIRRGLGKPNIIYVKNFATGLKNVIESLETPINPQNRENHDSEFVKITNPESSESRFRIRENHEQSIHTIKDTNFIDTESESTSDTETKTLSTDNGNDNDNELLANNKGKEKEPPVSHTDQSTETESSIPKNLTNSRSSEYDYTTYRRIIQEHIEYSHYFSYRRFDIDLIDELIDCMLDVICTAGGTVKINGEEKSREMVIYQYLKINASDIEHILDRYKEQRHKITHLHAYLKTMLYTVKQENGFYYTNAVRVDGVV